MHEAEPRTFNRKRLVFILCVGLLILLPVFVKLTFYPAYPGSDDAFIHLAVAEHILDGHGWGVVSNDRVNLSSSPLFTVLLLPILAIGSVGLAQAFSLVFASAALAVTYFTMRAMMSSEVSGLAALVVAAANVHLWRWSGTVMESSLAYLAVTAIAATTLWIMRSKRESTWHFLVLGILVGLGTEVRFEIGLFLPLTCIALWFSGGQYRTRLLAIIVGFCVSFAPWLGFATAYFGSPLPTTFLAKTTGFHFVNLTITKQLGAVVISGFGLSILLAVVAVVIAISSGDGRSRLRSYALPLMFLMAWPIALFAFYYFKTPYLQSAARYYLPGMATWPFAFGLVVSSIPALALHRYRFAATSALAACLAVGMVINMLTISPVLTMFNSGYRSAMDEGAAYLRAHCRQGDVALIYVDIGIMAHDGIGDCSLKDGGALATPSLRGMELEQEIAAVHPTYLIQSIGQQRDEWSAEYPGLKLLLSRAYADRGVERTGQEGYLNIYAVQ